MYTDSNVSASADPQTGATEYQNQAYDDECDDQIAGFDVSVTNNNNMKKFIVKKMKS